MADKQNGNFEISLNGKTFTNDGEAMNVEEARELMETVNQGLNTVMNNLNDSLRGIMGGINLGPLSGSNLPDIDPQSLAQNVSNSLSNLNATNWTNKLPVFETTSANGKFQFLLNQRKLFEMDLSNLTNRE